MFATLSGITIGLQDLVHQEHLDLLRFTEMPFPIFGSAMVYCEFSGWRSKELILTKIGHKAAQKMIDNMVDGELAYPFIGA